MYHYKQKICSWYWKAALYGPLVLGDNQLLYRFKCSTDPWEVTTVYDLGLVDIKALYDLPERYDPRLENISFIAAKCPVSN